jgi:hypothetical protein
VTTDDLIGLWSAYNQSGQLIHKAYVGDYLRGAHRLHTRGKDHLLIATSYSGVFICP